MFLFCFHIVVEIAGMHPEVNCWGTTSYLIRSYQIYWRTIGSLAAREARLPYLIFSTGYLREARPHFLSLQETQRSVPIPYVHPWANLCSPTFAIN